MAVTYQAVYINSFKGHFIHKIQGHHNHPGNPEENNIETCYQYIGGMEGFQQLSNILVVIGIGPAQRSKSPKARGEPGIQYILILLQIDVAQIIFFADFLFGTTYINITLIIVPGRNPVSPPQLAGDTPVLDIAHPGKVHVFVLFGHKLNIATFHSGNGFLCQWCSFYIPLVREVGLDNNTRAVSTWYF